MKTKNKLRNAMKRFRQGRITFEKLSIIKLSCAIEETKQANSEMEQTSIVEPEETTE